MHRKYQYMEYKKALMHFSEYGTGKKVLLCFHGFAQSNEHFKQLEEALKDEYRIFSFDLFYHGKSFWHEKDKPLTKEFWNELINLFIEQNHIEKFSLLGFSMGGKFTLATLENHANKVEKIILIAPDGIKTSLWYNLATYPGWIRKIFRRIIIKPELFFNLTKVFGFLNIVDRGILRFAKTQMNTRKQRRRVYYSWVVFKDLKFDMNEVASLLNKNNIPLEMFLGQYDKIITQKNMNRLLNKISNYQIHILQSGHSSLIDAVAHYYKNS